MRRSTRILVCAAVVLGASAQSYAAEQYPTHPVRMIVPFQPGGASDFVARIIEPGLTKGLGQNVIIENRVGASGYVGVEAASQATPDGHTFLLGNIGTMAINASVFPKFKVKPLDAFIGVTQVVDVPGVVAVHPSLPVTSSAGAAPKPRMPGDAVRRVLHRAARLRQQAAQPLVVRRRDGARGGDRPLRARGDLPGDARPG